VSEINLKLKKVTSYEATYEVNLEGSQAVAEFSVRSDDYSAIFSCQHFLHGVHRCVDLLKRLDPELHQDEIKKAFNEV